MRELTRRGHDDHPRRAVGERRADDRRDRLLHGEGRDPVPRPDRRAPRPARRPALGVPRGRGDARRPTAAGVRAPTARDAAPARAPAATSATVADAAARGAGRRRSASAASRALDDVSFAVGTRRDRRVHRAERRRQDDAVRRHLRLHAARRRHDRAARRRRRRSHDITPRPPQARARLGLGRSFQDARLFPALTVHETIAVALERHVDGPRPDRRRAPPPDGPPTPRRHVARPGRRAHRAHGPRRVPRQVRPRAVDREPPHRRPRLRRSPTARRCSCSTSRRAASPSARPRRSARCCCASATRSDASLARDRARHAAARRRSSDRLIALDLGQVDRHRNARATSSTTRRSSPPTWESTEAAIERSGAQGALLVPPSPD